MPVEDSASQVTTAHGSLGHQATSWTPACAGVTMVGARGLPPAYAVGDGDPSDVPLDPFRHSRESGNPGRSSSA